MVQSAFKHSWTKFVCCFLSFVEQVERDATQILLGESFQKPPRIGRERCCSNFARRRLPKASKNLSLLPHLILKHCKSWKSPNEWISSIIHLQYCNQERAKGPLSTPYLHPPQGENCVWLIFLFFLQIFTNHKLTRLK